MKRLTTILLSVIAAFSFNACNDELKITLEDIDVEFTVPAEITLEPGTTTLDFEVRNGKAPRPDDMIILNGPRGQFYCKIISTDEKKFSISLYENFANGEHEITIQRGLASAYAGVSFITIEKYDDGVHPMPGSTIYGRVSCEGTGIPGVVVSDGVEVVKTDDKGIYQIASKKTNGYVFISLPSGYQVALDVVVPEIWIPLSLAESTPERADFELIPAKDQTNFKLLAFGDLHLADRNKDIAQFQYFLEDVADFRKNHPGEQIYGLTLGDMTWDRYWITNSYSFAEYKNQMKPLAGFPVFQTVGNHDHDIYQAGDFLTIKPYRKHLGPSYYSYNIGGVHLVSLDNIDCRNPGANMTAEYGSRVVAEEIEWLKKDLAHVSKDTPIILSMHAQMYGNPVATVPATVSRSMSNAAELESVLKGFNEVHVFTAHTHVIYHVKNGNIFEHNAGAICATWWWSGKFSQGVSVCTDGSAAGYTVVDVKGKEITYQYKAIKQDIKKQFYAYDRNEMELSSTKYVPSASADNLKEWNARVNTWKYKSSDNYVYINIWNWDPDWKVEVKEGNNVLPVTIVRDYDPLHLIAHSAHRLNGSSNPNFLTNNGGVFHRVKASSPTSTLTIKVTDRFGNVYTEDMKRPKKFDVTEYKAY